MKKKLSAGAVLVIALLIIGMTAAVAEIIIQYNQGWYYENRFTNLKANYPDTYQEIMDHLAAPKAQRQTENSLVDVTVQDAAYVAEKSLLTFTVRVAAKEPDKYELHDIMALDADGFADDRQEHWLFISDPTFSAPSKYGPPYEVMNAPGKTLILFNSGELYLENGRVWEAYDYFKPGDGTLIAYYALHLNDSDDTDVFTPTGATAEVELSYRVVEYIEGMENSALYYGGEPGQITFTVELE